VDLFKLFKIEGSSFKTTDDPLVSIKAYTARLYSLDDDIILVRARFMKIFCHKLSQVEYLSKPRKNKKQAIISKSSLATTGIDTSVETSDSKRLGLLCLDISSSYQQSNSD
jgi:hypothetical protein